MGSTRFPGKPLADLGGKPMVQWVVEAARRAEITDRVVVATCDQVIVDACAAFGAEAIMTRDDHPSGTDRIGEVSEKIPADVYVNVQGDEPLIPVETIRACAAPLLADASILMGSVFSECKPEEEDDPSVVKVVTDRAGFALYFSRHAIPFPRNPRPQALRKHVGIYAYRREVLQDFCRWPMGTLEEAESLEQLRFLENGVRIKMSEGSGSAIAVDTPEQAEQVRQVLAGGRS